MQVLFLYYRLFNALIYNIQYVKAANARKTKIHKYIESTYFGHLEDLSTRLYLLTVSTSKNGQVAGRIVSGTHLIIHYSLPSKTEKVNRCFHREWVFRWRHDSDRVPPAVKWSPALFYAKCASDTVFVTLSCTRCVTVKCT